MTRASGGVDDDDGAAAPLAEVSISGANSLMRGEGDGSGLELGGAVDAAVDAVVPDSPGRVLGIVEGTPLPCVRGELIAGNL